MTDHCAPTFEKLAGELGFSCEEAGGLFEVRNPFALENWTLPVLELTIVLGAILALIYAIVRLRRHGDPTNLVVWFGATAYLFIIEPPLYFPAAFGIDEHVDTMFAHNVFTVEFLWGRLPLYIVAIYPLMATLAFETVRSLGVFRRYGVLVGAVCVGFVHHGPVCSPMSTWCPVGFHRVATQFRAASRCGHGLSTAQGRITVTRQRPPTGSAPPRG